MQVGVFGRKKVKQIERELVGLVDKDFLNVHKSRLSKVIELHAQYNLIIYTYKIITERCVRCANDPYCHHHNLPRERRDNDGKDKRVK
jgi:hypothetical protein